VATLRRSMARRRLDQRLAAVKSVDHTAPRHGWIRAIRESLGMPARVMGERLGVTEGAVFAMERSEGAGTVQLDTLRRAADALDCDVVYALVPRSSLDSTVRAAGLEALALHDDLVRRTMLLEDQAVDPEERQAQLAVMLDRIIDSRELWRH
jgi:predicted DNA-binding mobile mystery protein A